jgi:MoaA/NifB/PqqE/SkfB family radical SAM enzyme
MKSPLGRLMAWKGSKMQTERSYWQPLLVLYKLARLIKATCKRLYIRNRNPLHSLRIFYIRATRPHNLRIEASSKCQLHCSGCRTGDGSNKTGNVGWGHLRFENLKELIDHNPGVKEIELSNWGEMFLNPDLLRIMQYGYEKKIRFTANNGTNFNNATEESIEGLVKYRFHSFRVSIDGATNPTYQTFRRGGNLDRVSINIERVNHYKGVYHSRFPIMTWIFIVFDHNVHEVPLAREMARRLNMDFATSVNFTNSLPPIRDKERARRESDSGIATREDFKERTGVGFWQHYGPCRQLWEQPQINWDGKLFGCCGNRYGDFGNVFESSLDTCLQSEKYVYAKEMLLGLRESRDDIPCSKCGIYQHRLWHPPNKDN